jgi:hypothetical protein
MKEFVLTQPYSNLEEMMNSAEVGIYKEELKNSDIKEYAIISRIGNRYDLNGNKIEGYAKNPFNKIEETNDGDGFEKIEEKILEEVSVKYLEVEQFIDNAITKAIEETKFAFEQKIEELKEQHNKEIEKLKEAHALELAQVKYDIKAELIAKLNS